MHYPPFKSSPEKTIKTLNGINVHFKVLKPNEEVIQQALHRIGLEDNPPVELTESERQRVKREPLYRYYREHPGVIAAISTSGDRPIENVLKRDGRIWKINLTAGLSRQEVDEMVMSFPLGFIDPYYYDFAAMEGEEKTSCGIEWTSDEEY